jgi:voltage-dependent calcium channel T type alpha-1G
MYCLLQVVECSGVGGSMLGTEAMTCQELLALSGALSAALPTGQLGLGSFFTSLSKGGKLLSLQLVRTQLVRSSW